MEKSTFQQYYEPLPDIGRALARIGCENLEIKYDIETLDRLVYGFATHVPYENLEVTYEHRMPSLAIRDLYDKFVNRRRGGYCMEMNGFFWALLRDLGFNIYSTGAFVLEYHDNIGDMGHRVNIVEVGRQKYVADVGFGGKNIAYFAVPLDGSEKEGFFVKYNPQDREYTLCRLLSKEEAAAEEQAGNGRFVKSREAQEAGSGENSYLEIVMFRDYKAYPTEFTLPNLAFQHMEHNPMLENRIVNLRNDKGEVYTIYNDIFKGKTSQGRFEKRIENDDELLEIVGRYFGMLLESR